MRIIAPASFSAFAFAGLLLELWSMGVRRAFEVIRLSILDNLFNSTAPRSKDLQQPQRMDSNPYRLAIHNCQPLISIKADQISPAHGLPKRPMRPVAPLVWPVNLAKSSSRVRPGCSSVGSRSVAINMKV